MAECVHSLPVLIKRLLALSPWVHQVVHELLKRDVTTLLQSLRPRVSAVTLHYLGAIAFVKGSVVASCEFVAIGRDKSFKRISHKYELQVRTQTAVNLRCGVLGERAKPAWGVGLVSRDGERITVASITRQDHQRSLPVGAGHLGNVAVKQSMSVIHQQVAQVLGAQDTTFTCVRATCFVQKRAATLQRCPNS